MNAFKAVELFEAPSRILKEVNTEAVSITEMSDVDHGILCGLIRDFKPHKIVEVGVAEGGTTAVILSCLQELNMNCSVYSIDALEYLWNAPDQKVGWVLNELREKGIDFPGQTHTLFTGKILPEVLHEIGSGIDFLILDTVHSMPGENLDFLTAFPYLSDDAVVVLHDISLSQRDKFEQAIATNVLFSSVTADKYLNLHSFLPDYPEGSLINIAAFQLNPDTPKYILDVFAALMLPWTYLPPEAHLNAYGNIISKLGPQCMDLFQRAVNNTIRKKKMAAMEWLKAFDWSPYRYVLLYGNGQRGKSFLHLCKNLDIPVAAFVVSDGRQTEGGPEEIPIYAYSDIPYEARDVLMVQTTLSDEVARRLENSDYQVLKIPEEMWENIFLFACIDG